MLHDVQFVSQSRYTKGFFDDIPDRAHVSARHRLHPWSWASHVSTLHGQFSSLFHPVHPDAHDTSSRPRPEFHWVQNRLPGRRSGEEIKLHKRRSAVVDVPYAQGKRRNASAREKRRVIIPLKPKNLAASTSHPPNSNVTQQSSGGAQDQTSSHTQAAVSPSSIALPIANTISHTNSHATVENAGRWTRFWLFFCCASPEYTMIITNMSRPFSCPLRRRSLPSHPSSPYNGAIDLLHASHTAVDSNF